MYVSPDGIGILISSFPDTEIISFDLKSHLGDIGISFPGSSSSSSAYWDQVAKNNNPEKGGYEIISSKDIEDRMR